MCLIKVSGHLEMQGFLTENNLSSYQMVNLTIGNDDKIFVLFAESVPDRINGMFVPTNNNSIYKAACFTVDWYSGEVYSIEVMDFGIQEINFHFIQPIGDNILLLGARANKYKDGNTDKNAFIIDRSGNQIKSFCVGDGIGNCLVDSENNIITSYFDEGIFGNNGWNKPIGTSGIIKWSSIGENLWENKDHDICDCYAMNIDDNGALWFYYYEEFNLVKTDYKTEVVYDPGISGSHGVLISKNQDALLLDKGYGEKGFCMLKINQNRNSLSKAKDAIVVYNDIEISVERFAFRSSKAVFTDITGAIYFIDWIYG